MGDLVWVPVAEVETLPETTHSTVEVLRDQWWLHNGRGEVALYRPSPRSTYLVPQCNANATIAQRRADAEPDARGIMLVRVAYRPHDCADYR